MITVKISLTDSETGKEWALGSKEEDWPNIEMFLRSMEHLKRSAIRTILTIKELSVEEYFKGQTP